MKNAFIISTLALLTACSNAEQKVPKDDLQSIFVSMAIKEMERRGSPEAQQAVDDYRSQKSTPVTIDEYSCTDVATDTFDCKGKLAAKMPGTASSIDFQSRVMWKDGTLTLVGPAKLNGAEMYP